MRADVKYLLIAEDFTNVSTARYRSWNRMDQMRHAGLDTILYVGLRNNPNLWIDTKGRTAIVQRLPYTPKDTAYFERLKSECVRVGFDIDDLIYEHHRLPHTVNIKPELCLQYVRAIHWADFVTCSTPELATEIRNYWFGKPVYVIPNVIDQKITTALTNADLTPRNSSRVTIGYTSATLTHQKDFELVMSVLDGLLQSFPHIDVVLVGTLDHEMAFVKKWGNRVQLWPFVTYDALPFLIHGTIDINLVPLIDTPFNRCKSLVKWLEAAIVGVPTVCSRIGQFKNLPEGTAYCAVTPEEWRYFIELLIRSKEHRQEIGNKARRHAFSQYTYLNPYPLSCLKDI